MILGLRGTVDEASCWLKVTTIDIRAFDIRVNCLYSLGSA